MIKQSRWNCSYIVGKVMMGLVLTAIIGSVNAAPSYGDDNSYRQGRGDNGRYEHRGHGYGHGRWRDRDGYRYYNDGYRERIYYDDVYRERVYVPPPEPGIRVFFPPIYIH